MNRCFEYCRNTLLYIPTHCLEHCVNEHVANYCSVIPSALMVKICIFLAIMFLTQKIIVDIEQISGRDISDHTKDIILGTVAFITYVTIIYLYD